MEEAEFRTRVAAIMQSLWPSWYEHRWNDETSTELWNLIGAYRCEDVLNLLREFYRDHNCFSHAEFSQLVRKRFKPRFDAAKWRIDDEHHYRMLWKHQRHVFASETDSEFDEWCFYLIGKRPTQHERAEATAMLNKHIRETNERLKARNSRIRLLEYGEIDPGF